jgi:hypothetical protein
LLGLAVLAAAAAASPGLAAAAATAATASPGFAATAVASLGFAALFEGAVRRLEFE